MTRPRGRAMALYALGATVVAVFAIGYGFERFVEVLPDYPRDGYIDWGGARAIVAGQDPYSAASLQQIGLDPIKGLGHPPTALVWFLPLAPLDAQTMKLVWDGLTLVMLVLMIQLLVDELALPARPATTAMLFGLVLASSWMRDHLAIVQMSTAIAFLYTIAWYCLRRDREIPAGLALGLALTMKFYPGAVIALLLLSGRVRVAAAAGGAWLAVAAAMTWRLGVGSWEQFLAQTRWYTLRWTADIRNASLGGIVQRLRWPVCENAPGSEHEIWWTGAVLAALCAAGLAALILHLGRRAAGDGPTIDLPFASFAALSMIVGPYTWEHYNVTLLLPIAIAAIAVVREHGTGRWAPTLAAGMIVAAIVVLLGLDIYDKDDVWRRFAVDRSLHVRLHALEVFNWLPAPLTIALLCALMVRARRDDFRSVAGLRLTPDPERAS